MLCPGKSKWGKVRWRLDLKIRYIIFTEYLLHCTVASWHLPGLCSEDSPFIRGPHARFPHTLCIVLSIWWHLSLFMQGYCSVMSVRVSGVFGIGKSVGHLPSGPWWRWRSLDSAGIQDKVSWGLQLFEHGCWSIEGHVNSDVWWKVLVC